MVDVTERQFDPDELVALAGTDGATLTEIADAMDAPTSTTEYRCGVLVDEGRLEKWEFGSGTHGRAVYFQVDE